ncbi:MAG: hypothetical protein P1U32_04405 [Legionellaceae bacterium]|nr:hypothetical protein [Legionellaceae bacterium]
MAKKKLTDEDYKLIAAQKEEVYKAAKALIEAKAAEDEAYQNSDQRKRDLADIEAQRQLGKGPMYEGRIPSLEGDFTAPIRRLGSSFSKSPVAEAKRNLHNSRNNLQRTMEEKTGKTATRSPEDSGNYAGAGLLAMTAAAGLLQVAPFLALIPAVGPFLAIAATLVGGVLGMVGFGAALYYGARKLGRMSNTALSGGGPDYNLDGDQKLRDAEREARANTDQADKTATASANQSTANITTQKSGADAKAEANIGAGQDSSKIKDAFKNFAKDDAGNNKEGFAIKDDPTSGNTILTFPDEASQQKFFEDLAGKKIPFEAKNEKGEVIAFSSGQGELSRKGDPGFAEALQHRENSRASSASPDSNATTQMKVGADGRIADEFNAVAKEGDNYKDGYKIEQDGENMKMTFPNKQEQNAFFQSLHDKGISFEAKNEKGEVIASSNGTDLHLAGEDDATKSEATAFSDSGNTEHDATANASTKEALQKELHTAQLASRQSTDGNAGTGSDGPVEEEGNDRGNRL